MIELVHVFQLLYVFAFMLFITKTGCSPPFLNVL
uniref:Uncharacterized protein n=1 Tax=Anguilla anguilla TaxID=7936 RepID=A0A0E9UQY0_ANGAN